MQLREQQGMQQKVLAEAVVAGTMVSACNYLCINVLIMSWESLGCIFCPLNYHTWYY